MNILSDLSKYGITDVCNSSDNSTYTKRDKCNITDTLRDQWLYNCK